MFGLRLIFFYCLIQFENSATAGEAIIYQHDTTKNVPHQATSSIFLTAGRIIQTDSLGNKLYHKQQYRIKDGQIYETNSIGNIQYHKPHSVILKMDQ